MLSQLSLVSPPTTAQSGVASSSFTVQLKDSAGNAVSTSGKSITVGAFTSSACSAAASGTFSAASSTSEATNGSGVASFTSMTYTGSIGTVYLLRKRHDGWVYCGLSSRYDHRWNSGTVGFGFSS